MYDLLVFGINLTIIIVFIVLLVQWYAKKMPPKVVLILIKSGKFLYVVPYKCFPPGIVALSDPFFDQFPRINHLKIAFYSTK